MTTDDRCAACGRVNLNDGRYWKRWKRKRACPTCYERARRGGDFYRHAVVRAEEERKRFVRIAALESRGFTERAIAEKLSLPKSTIHDCKVRHG